MLTLRDLFQVVYELKKKEVENAKHKVVDPATEVKETTEEPVYQVCRINDKKKYTAFYYGCLCAV